MRAAQRGDRLAVGVGHLADGEDQLVAPGVLDVVDALDAGSTSPATDRPVQLERLLAVHDERVVQAERGVDDRPLRREAEAQHREERRRRDDVAVAERLRGVRVEVRRVGVADRLGEAADVLAPDLVGRRGRVLPADELAVDRHAAPLPDAGGERPFAARIGP